MDVNKRMSYDASHPKFVVQDTTTGQIRRAGELHSKELQRSGKFRILGSVDDVKPVLGSKEFTK